MRKKHCSRRPACVRQSSATAALAAGTAVTGPSSSQGPYVIPSQRRRRSRSRSSPSATRSTATGSSGFRTGSGRTRAARARSRCLRITSSPQTAGTVRDHGAHRRVRVSRGWSTRMISRSHAGRDDDRPRGDVERRHQCVQRAGEGRRPRPALLGGPSDTIGRLRQALEDRLQRARSSSAARRSGTRGARSPTPRAGSAGSCRRSASSPGRTRSPTRHRPEDGRGRHGRHARPARCTSTSARRRRPATRRSAPA